MDRRTDALPYRCECRGGTALVSLHTGGPAPAAGDWLSARETRCRRREPGTAPRETRETRAAS